MKSKLAGITLLILCFCTFSAHSDSDIASILEKHRGEVVLLDFWASWCAPCLKSFPWMNDLSRDLGTKGLTVIAINLDSDSGAARKFLDENPALFSVLIESGTHLAEELRVDTMPSSFLFSRNGELVHQQRGFQTKHSALYRSLIVIELKR